MNSMLRRQARQPKLTRADRALLAALSRSLPRVGWAVFSVKPATLLHWHRQLVARRWTYAHRAPGRPPLESSLRALIVRLGRENPHWGYRRIVGELKGLGISVSATSVRKVLLKKAFRRRRSGAHLRGARSCAHRPQPCLPARLPHRRDRFPATDLRAVLHLARDATDRVHRLHLESRRAGHWVAQQARNLVMRVGDEHPSGSSSTTATRNSATPSTRSFAPTASG
jgi:putative transposase